LAWPGLCLGLVLFAYGWGWCDYRESSVRHYYGREEGNKLFRAPDGSFETGKAVAISLPIYLLVAFGVYFAGNRFKGETQDYNVGAFAAAAWLAGIGLVHGGIGWHNAGKDAAHRRDKQFVVREAFKRNVDDPANIQIRNFATDSEGRLYLKSLPWIRGASVEQLKLRLLEWAAIPETEPKKIWVDLKYHPN
jgi:hypothetical protein